MIQDLILSNLIKEQEYFTKVIPFIKPEYFEDRSYRILAEEIKNFSEKYNKIPTAQVLGVSVEKRSDLDEKTFKETILLIKSISSDTDKQNIKWLIDQTEEYFKERALYNAMTKSISVMQGNDKIFKREAIPDIIKNALAISFDTSVGHDFFEDYESRYKQYNEIIHTIRFKQEKLNYVTSSGFTRKTLNVVAGGTNSFKTGTLCDFSSYWLNSGYNVLYITLEMSEYKIAQRIEANTLKTEMDDIKNIPYEIYSSKIKNLKNATNGRLVVKEYPTATANVSHFRILLNDLLLKKNFIPDIIVVDYLSICTPFRFKTADLYLYNKAIAEELRGLAVEYNCAVWTGAQLTRSGQSSSDPNLENIGESHGISATADFMFAVVITEELEEKNMAMIKILKNRYQRKGKMRRFMLGVDFSRMTLYDIDDDQEIKKTLQKNKSLKEKEKEIDLQFVEKKKISGTNFNFD